LKNRRRIPRKYLMFNARVFDTVTGKLIGQLLDVTPGGLMLLSERAVAPDTAYTLRLELTGGNSDVSFIELEARSRWCRRDVDPAFYCAGFQITALSPEAAGVIRHIIEAYGFLDN